MHLPNQGVEVIDSVTIAKKQVRTQASCCSMVKSRCAKANTARAVENHTEPLFQKAPEFRLDYAV